MWKLPRRRKGDRTGARAHVGAVPPATAVSVAVSAARPSAAGVSRPCAVSFTSMALPREIVTEVLKLPDEERAELVHVLLESLDGDEECEASAEELAEVDQGLAEIDRGEYVTADDLLARLRQIP